MSVTIWKFMETWEGHGYGFALVDFETDTVIAPYVDPNDYPDMEVEKEATCTKVISGEYKGYWISAHSGCYEEQYYRQLRNKTEE